ncbi:DUF1737 domain-containing protein [Roseibium porphyridii]|uniref:DUF1737 domain-containing protein n=1 Tax=Roseibium porphyridii TaxID=2866279 RepID=A0ABY8F454_9HYPH|nr:MULTISPECIES: DUF1737 domain-containing protein [Stappiaceae]QFT29292.1 hypothetical protein FIV00_02225 [Labrenzia sp. THAF82]WFE90280.1 DUF1737 domain-containing protein [Roseibium sp. KMA01]
MKLYRFITGVDDSEFCHRVTQALNKGWQLQGSPSLTYDATRGATICGQAVTKDVEGETYSRDMKLGDY